MLSIWHIRWLPHWANPDNPIVRRELSALPPFLGRGGKLRDKALFVGLAALGITVSACLCGGTLTGMLLFPLGLLPMFYSATTINREINGHTWQDLRATPPTVREIVLSKLTAVTYRLGPLLGLLLVMQLFSLFFSSLIWTLYTNSTIMINGQIIQQSDGFTTVPPSLLGQMIFLFLATALKALYDFLAAVALGGLASALATRKGTAYVLAIGLKGVHFILNTALALLIVAVALGNFNNALSAVVFTAMGNAQSVLISLFPDARLALLSIGIMFAMEAGLLYGIIELTIWRASRYPA